MKKRMILLLAVLLTVVAAAGYLETAGYLEKTSTQPNSNQMESNSPSKVPPGVSEPRVNSEGGVEIIAVYQGNNIFTIALNTHSGSLDYDLKELAYVRDNNGKIYKPLEWEGGTGGHHLKGLLKFPEFDDKNGFELVVKDVAGVKERTFKW